PGHLAAGGQGGGLLADRRWLVAAQPGRPDVLPPGPGRGPGPDRLPRRRRGNLVDPAVLEGEASRSRQASPLHAPTGPGPYVELHLHTNYSLLDGASHPEELIARAVRFGYSALAITDHDNLFGAMVFARKCKENGLRAITGVELTLAEAPQAGPRHHLTLL